MRGKRLDDSTLRYAAKGFRASVTPADFAPLLPALKAFTETYDAALEARGTRRSLRVKRLYLADRSLSTLIRAKGRVRFRGTVPAWDCSFTPLRISGNTLRRIAQAARKPLPGPLDGLGNIFYHGSFAHNAGRPTESRCPITSIQPLSCKVCITFCDTATPRMPSMSPRVTGCW